MKFTIGGESHEVKIDSWQRSNVSPSIELTVERTMIKTQYCPNCEATEQKLEDYKQKVSDALLRYHAPTHVPHGLQDLIIPAPKPDPLEEILSEIDHAAMWVDECAKEIRASLDARGFEIREKG